MNTTDDTHVPTGTDQCCESSIDPRIERTRAAVAAAAGELLLADGPDAITHSRVAAAADVSRTTVYKHWPERGDLLRSTLEAVGKKIPTSEQFSGDLRGDLRTLLSGLATDLNDDNRSRMMTMMLERAQHDPTVALVRDSMVCELHETIEQLLRTAIDNGELRRDIDTERAMAGLGGSLLFSSLLADRSIDDQLLDGVIDDFVTTNAPR